MDTIPKQLNIEFDTIDKMRNFDKSCQNSYAILLNFEQVG